MGLDQGAQRVAGEQCADVSAGHHDFPGQLTQRGQPGADGVAGASGLFLDGGGHLRRDVVQMRLDLLTLVADHHHKVLGFQRTGRLDGVAEHRTAGELVQHLRGGRLHPGARTGRHDDDGGDTPLVGSGHEFSKRSMATRGLSPKRPLEPRGSDASLMTARTPPTSRRCRTSAIIPATRSPNYSGLAELGERYVVRRAGPLGARTDGTRRTAAGRRHQEGPATQPVQESP